MTKKNYILLALIILKFFLQYLLLSPEYELQRDEFLHLDQANHPAWGYTSVPPLTSFISSIIQFLGNGIFWVKFFPALFGALTVWVVWKTVEELKGGMFALTVAATGVIFSALLRINTLYQPNSLDILCWTALLYALVRYARVPASGWIYVAAVFFALGMLNKYNIAFLAMALLPALLISPQRAWLKDPKIYTAGIISLMIISPNFIWQFQNQFPVIGHMQELAETQLVNVNRADFLKSQLLFFFSSVPLIVLGVIALFIFPEFKPYRFLFWNFIFVLLIFLYFRAKDYYTIGLYPIYIAFGAKYAEILLEKGKWKVLRPAFFVFHLAFFAILYPVAFPNKSPEEIVKNNTLQKDLGLLRWEDGKDHHLPQDFADMLGWHALAHKVDSVLMGMPHAEKTLVLCDNYGQAGAINYYKRFDAYVAQSFNADYKNWLNLDTVWTDVVLVKDKDDEDKLRNEERPLFDTVYCAAIRISPYAREDSIYIYVLQGTRIHINQRLKAELQENEK